MATLLCCFSVFGGSEVNFRGRVKAIWKENPWPQKWNNLLKSSINNSPCTLRLWRWPGSQRSASYAFNLAHIINSGNPQIAYNITTFSFSISTKYVLKQWIFFITREVMAIWSWISITISWKSHSLFIINLTWS